MANSIAVLGGGVAGLSAAHELVERGFQVTVYERRHVVGGKARSMGDPHTGTDGRPDLPGEHGFRFFPGFYKHLPDTMKRIPYGGNPQGVFSNLTPSTQFLLAHEGKPDTIMAARFPLSLKELVTLLNGIFHLNTGIPLDEILHFAERIFVILTSCQERRLKEYEKIPWWDFIGAATRSLAYQQYLAEGLTRSLVAMKAEVGSTRTVGDILIQLMINATTPFETMDRVLKGPTSDVWITPWREFLRQKGVQFRLGDEIVSLQCVSGRIATATVKTHGGPLEQISADYFVAALPIEVMAPLVNADMIAVDPKLANLAQLKYEWMSGIQFYLLADTPLVNGHAIYVDTPWALTSISQAQFWTSPVTGYGDGTVHGVLSVDISDWNANGILYGKPAMHCSREEIRNEVAAQLRRSLDLDPDVLKLADSNIWGYHLDPDIKFPNPHADVNLEPLMVNVADSWRYRPEAKIGIPNLVLASDYVRTYTDLATMEGANEAARRAVNAILDDTGSGLPRCKLWPLHEPDIFAPARAYDFIRFEMGLPHAGLAEAMAKLTGT